MSNLTKRIVLFVTVIFSCIFISNYAFANNDTMANAVNGVRNVVGGAENVVENAAKDTTTTVRDGFNNVGNATQNAVSTTRTATRTATGTNNTNTMWTWFIVGIIALIVIGVVWYMATRNNDNSSHR